jgi:hypothetical protein
MKSESINLGKTGARTNKKVNKNLVTTHSSLVNRKAESIFILILSRQFAADEAKAAHIQSASKL